MSFNVGDYNSNTIGRCIYSGLQDTEECIVMLSILSPNQMNRTYCKQFSFQGFQDFQHIQYHTVNTLIVQTKAAMQWLIGRLYDTIVYAKIDKAGNEMILNKN